MKKSEKNTTIIPFILNIKNKSPFILKRKWKKKNQQSPYKICIASSLANQSSGGLMVRVVDENANKS